LAEHADRDAPAAIRGDALLVNLARRASQLTDPTTQAEVRALLERGERLDELGVAERHQLINDIMRLCHVRDMPEVLSLSGVPVVYNFQQTFEENIGGPWDRYPDWDGVTRGRRWTLLGVNVGYPIGVPASALTANARYVDYYARHGFNVLTYKTVRSRPRAPHPFPNWVYLEDADQPLPVADEEPPVGPVTGDAETYPVDPHSFSTANSFGVPSEHPDVWTQDVADALDRIGDGKLLIVSVMGSPEEPDIRSAEALAQDFVAVALYAQQAGARAIELNLSCPNTLDPVTHQIDPPVCLDPDLTELIVTRVAEALDAETRLVAKLSWMRHTMLEQVLRRFAHRVHAVSGINTLPMRVVDRAGQPTFGERRVAGVSGNAIRDFGLDFVRTLAELKHREDWVFDIIGMGGVMSAEDVRAYLRAGADAVQTATGAEDKPTLPADLLREFDDALGPEARILLGVLEHRPGADLPQLASAARLAPSAVRAGLGKLRSLGVLHETRSEGGQTAFRVVESATGALLP